MNINIQLSLTIQITKYHSVPVQISGMVHENFFFRNTTQNIQLMKSQHTNFKKTISAVEKMSAATSNIYHILSQCIK